jgi:hypothetical protein
MQQFDVGGISLKLLMMLGFQSSKIGLVLNFLCYTMGRRIYEARYFFIPHTYLVPSHLDDMLWIWYN